MIKVFVYTVVFFILISIQVSFFHTRDIGFLFVPNIFLSIVFCYTVLYGFDESIIFLLLMSFFYDILFAESFGIMMLSTLVFSYGISVFVHRVMVVRRILGRMIFFMYGILSFWLYQIGLFWYHGILDRYVQSLFSKEYFVSLCFELVLSFFILWVVWNGFVFLQQKGFLTNKQYTFS